jgi:hypothetical protein
MQHLRRPNGSLDAGPDDPVIGVYVLSQFAFCPRAGLCAYEANQEWTEDDPLPAQLDFLPRYDIRRVENAIGECVTKLTWFVAGLLFTLSAGLFLAMRFASELIWLLPVLLLPFLVAMSPTIKNLQDLLRCQWEFKTVSAAEPDPGSDVIQPVNWFAMLKAGFMSVPYSRLSHEKWKLQGKPWRVLRRGALRIPVFFQAATDERLHPKHLAKAAAYCHLLQTAETLESPYALVLKEGTLEGVAIPYNARSRRLFHDALRLARLTIQDAADGQNPAPPEQISLCSGCPFGEPHRYQPVSIEEKQERTALPMYVLLSKSKTIYHSHCGDRFEWIPPHKNAERLGLESL